MAALGAVVRLAAAGQHIIAGDDLYGGTSRLLQRIAPGLGLSVSNVDMSDPRCACPRSASCPVCGGSWLLLCQQKLSRHTVLHTHSCAAAGSGCGNGNKPEWNRPCDGLRGCCRNVAAAVQPGRTALVMVESPTNPRMQVCDIAALAAIAHDAGAICCVDNRWAAASDHYALQ